MTGPIRVAIVVSHPIQYHAPWFRRLASHPKLGLRVFYLWEFGVRETFDPGFETSFVWDVPLLDGYDSEFVRNVSGDPGTHHFKGLENPDLNDRLREWAPSVIILFGYAYRTHLGVLRAAELRSIPILIRGDSHDIGRRRSLGVTVRRWLRRRVFRRAFGALSVGGANRDYFRASGVPENRIFHVPQAVENDRFAAMEEAGPRQWRMDLGIPPNATVFLFAGKLEETKRPGDLIEALRRLTKELEIGPGCEPVAVFVGSGHLHSKLQAAAEDLADGSVYFVPFQNQSRMPTIYAASDVLVLVSGAETWGLVVNEAMAAGRPAIVSDHVGCARDLVIPGKTGWVVPAADTGALATAMREALDPGRRARMGEAARRHVVEHYSHEVATHRLVQALETVLGQSGDAR